MELCVELQSDCRALRGPVLGVGSSVRDIPSVPHTGGPVCGVGSSVRGYVFGTAHWGSSVEWPLPTRPYQSSSQLSLSLATAARVLFIAAPHVGMRACYPCERRCAQLLCVRAQAVAGGLAWQARSRERAQHRRTVCYADGWVRLVDVGHEALSARTKVGATAACLRATWYRRPASGQQAPAFAGEQGARGCGRRTSFRLVCERKGAADIAEHCLKLLEQCISRCASGGT